jgi:putative transposase
VSRSYYYARVAQRASGKGRPWILETRLKRLFNAHRGHDGSRRLMRALQKEGGSLGRYRTCRLMRKLGLKVHSRPRFRCTTESRHAYPIAPNRLDRNFNPTAPNQVWTADITYSVPSPRRHQGRCNRGLSMSGMHDVSSRMR